MTKIISEEIIKKNQEITRNTQTRNQKHRVSLG